jgi:nucleotide-binding universal stress UspA family protein
VLLIGDPEILPSIATLIRTGESEFPLQYGSHVVSLCNDQVASVLDEAKYLIAATRAEVFEAIACEAQRDRLEALVETCEAKGVPYEFSCSAEGALDSLLEEVRRRDVGVLICAPRRLPLLSRIGLGRSQTARIMDLVSSPVLVSRQTFPYRRVLIALAELVAELPTPMYFYTQVPLNVAADDELLELFHRASFRRFFLGIETFDGDKLTALDKEHNTELDVYEAVRKIQEHGITVWAGIIVGLDDDDEQTFEDQYQFISKSGITPTLVGLLQAQPGTPLHERVAREGRLREVADIVGSGAIGTLEAQALTNIKPTRIDEATQLSLTARFLRRVYAPDAVADRLIQGVERSRKTFPPVLDTVSAAGLKAIAKTTAYYVTHSEPRMRKHVRRILGYLATHRLRGLDELIYHLVIYKHMYEYYHQAADLCDAAARQITTHDVYLRD